MKKQDFIMKRYVSSTMKGFKKSQRSILRKHHTREITDDKNVYPIFSSGNVYTSIELTFFNCEAAMKKAKLGAGKRPCNINFSKNADVIVDNVVVLSRDQVMVVQSEYPFSWKDKIIECCKELASSINKHFGLLLMSIDFHVDEGYFRGKEFIENFHLHMTFFNFDFEKLVHPFRMLGKKKMQKLQDITGEAFAALGFERGISKEITGREHKEKAEFLATRVEELEAECKRKQVEMEFLNTSYNEALERFNTLRDKVSKIESKVIQVEEELGEKFTKNLMLELDLEKKNKELKVKESNSKQETEKVNLLRLQLTKLKGELSQVLTDSEQEIRVLNNTKSELIVTNEKLVRCGNELTIVEGDLSKLSGKLDDARQCANPREIALMIEIERMDGVISDLHNKLFRYESSVKSKLNEEPGLVGRNKDKPKEPDGNK
ncbi:hypothetical protein L4D20_09935 [Vibrio kyushuensis]|uniref:hypothetical protein n=1 Tax=Vibrio kyushuensis TaxID=2910249 RepID=UPI003D12E5FF